MPTDVRQPSESAAGTATSDGTEAPIEVSTR